MISKVCLLDDSNGIFHGLLLQEKYDALKMEIEKEQQP